MVLDFRRVTQLILGLALVALWAVTFSANVLAQGDGSLSGQVVNRTAGGSMPAGVPVTLQTFKGTSEAFSRETQSDPAGRFQFDGLGTAQDYQYQIVVRYKGVSYFSDAISFTGDSKPAPITLPVYETTFDAGNIHVERAHVIINVAPRSLQVGQIYVFSNPGDRTYIGAGEGLTQTLRFSLPPAASDVTFQDGEGEEHSPGTADSLADTSPVLPGVGSHQVLFSYSLTFDSPKYTFSITNHYSVTALNVLASDTQARLSSPVLQSEGLRSLQGQEWLSLSGGELAPDQVVRLDFDNLPLVERASTEPTGQTGKSPDKLQGLQLVVAGLVLLGLGAFIGYSYPRLRERQRGSPEAARPEAEAKPEEDEMVVALADLDDAFERGDLPEDEYRRQRAAVKQKLSARLRPRER